MEKHVQQGGGLKVRITRVPQELMDAIRRDKQRGADIETLLRRYEQQLLQFGPDPAFLILGLVQ